MSVSVFVAKLPLPVNWAQRLSEKKSRSSLQALPPTPIWGPRCSATSRLIVKHYLVVPCLSYDISAQGSTRDLCWHVPGQAWPCLCLIPTWGQVGVCTSRACSIMWIVQRQMFFSATRPLVPCSITLWMLVTLELDWLPWLSIWDQGQVYIHNLNL